MHSGEEGSGSQSMNSSLRRRRYLAGALRLAAHSLERRKHGAVLVAGGRVVGRGVNRANPDVALRSRGYWSIHAEMAACRRVTLAGRSGVLYVARTSNTGHGVMSRPCRLCQQQMRAIGIRLVIYTTPEGMEEMRL